MIFSSKRLLLGGMAALVFGLSACSSDGEGAVDPLEGAPLRPLIYTEYPGLTPEGAAVREERLARQLLEGVSEGAWGDLELQSEEELPELGDVEVFGAAFVEALVQQRRELWEHLFVSPAAYAELVHIRLERAAEFVDNQIGASQVLWDLFVSDSRSEMPQGGFESIFELEGVELGQGRRVDGGAAADDEEAVQFWGNRIFLRHRDEGVVFELRIPRIFYLSSPESGEGPQWQIASAVELDRKLRTFLDSGLHLKPQLLRPSEYPFPLNTGNFWRYRRRDVARAQEEVDPLEEGLHGGELSGPAATEVIQEVVQVSQYGSLRLVELRRAYDDAEHTRVREWWVATPRRIYLCDGRCRGRIEDLDWLLNYFANQSPILQFPLQLSESWGVGGGPGGVFVVDSLWHQVEVPAGSFPASYGISGIGPLSSTDRYLRRGELERYFAPGRGIVRRELLSQEGPAGPIRVVEELVEYRLAF